MKRVGIITIHTDLNYGAFLQAFALSYFLKLEKYEVKIIDYKKVPNSPRIYKFPKNIAYKLYNIPRSQRYYNFIKPMLSQIRYNSSEDIMNNFQERYDVLISGSDQIWNPMCGGLNKLNPVYYLAFASNDKYKKISYASSLGSYVYLENEIPYIQKWLNEYSHLSTREITGADQLKGILKRDVKVVLDPTLLLDKNRWSTISHFVNIKDKYVLVYYIDEIDEVTSYARNIANKNGWKVALMTNTYNRHPNVDINIPHCGPAEFLWLFEHAEYIVTNSFHGTAFAINFQKDFVSVIKRNSPQRAQTLLANVGLSERLLTNIDDLDKLSVHIDYAEPMKKLEDLKRDSINYLLNAIEN